MAPRKKARPVDSGGDTISMEVHGNDNVTAAGRGAMAVVSRGTEPPEDLVAWQKEMEKRIDALNDLLPADKTDLKENIDKVAKEAAKGKVADRGRLERLLNTICAMAPDIFDVAIATLANPLAGLGLVVKKIGERAKVEAKPA